MDTDRHHRSNSNNSSSSTSELFICFTSRLSSSSMKLTSKSILSPGRAREPSQISLSNSLSRRLRSNGSMKGGQASPMFPTNGKKRGCSFENPEPSSPKVTCIGQVRVKTKKQGKKMRTRSKRRGEVSFRRVEQDSNINNNNVEASNHQEYSQSHLNHHHHHQQQQQQECLPHRNQRWVHLPLTICEALRAFGAEFNCFLPCRSSCMASDKEKEDKAAGSSNGGSCGAVFARWLVAVQEGEGKGREIELVVGEEEEVEEEEDDERRMSYRRHVFEEIEFNEEKLGEGNESLQEEEARVSICIPPKNALLLMRCRSDPVRMAALANKFWEAPAPQVDDDEDEDDGNEEKVNGNVEEVGASEEQQRKIEHKEDLRCEKLVSFETIEEHQTEETEASLVILEAEDEDYQERSTDIGGVQEGNLVQQEEEAEIEVMNQPVSTQEIVLSTGSSIEEIADPETSMNHGNEGEILLHENEDTQEDSLRAEEEEADHPQEDTTHNIHEITPVPLQLEQESENFGQNCLQDQEPEPEPELAESLAVAELAAQESNGEKETTEKAPKGGGEEKTMTHEISEPEEPKSQQGQMAFNPRDRDSQPLLPDCLLLMMCEPKLSMEVSKETWVCGTDFIRWLPEHSRPVNKIDGKDEPKKRISVDKNPAPVHNSSLQQPPRSSCSYPAKPPTRGAGSESMSTMIEQKLVGSKAYEPFVLTRCKSEPMRSAAKLAPEACFWKNRKLEPHRPATLGVSAAGVGF